MTADDGFAEVVRIALDACAIARITGTALEEIERLGGPAGRIAGDALARVQAQTLSEPGELIRMATYDGRVEVPASLVIAACGRRPYDWDAAGGEGRW